MTSKIPMPKSSGQNGVFKPPPPPPPRKNTTAKIHKGYGQESELRDQKQHLVVANGELQNNLTEAKQRIAQLEQQYRDVQGENKDVQKRLKDCHVLLVAGNIDPVLGERIGKATQENEDQQREVVNVSRDLLGELVTFCDMTTEQSSRLDEVQKKMKDLSEAREDLMLERNNFSLEVEEMEKALEEAEMLLLE